MNITLMICRHVSKVNHIHTYITKNKYLYKQTEGKPYIYACIVYIILHNYIMYTYIMIIVILEVSFHRNGYSSKRALSILIFFCRLYRYISYRQFVRWIWHYLGTHQRKILPACVVSKIRSTFPSEEYTGFKYPKIDY